MCGCLLRTPYTRDLVLNPGMCSDWESNRQHFASHYGAQSTESHQPGLERSLWQKLRPSVKACSLSTGTQQEAIREKHPDLTVHPFSNLQFHQMPKTKDLQMTTRQVQGREQGRERHRGYLERQAGNIQPRPWISNHGTWFHKLQYSHTIHYYAAIL